MDEPFIAGFIAFFMTLIIAALRGTRFEVDTPGVIGGKQDIVPGTIGILSGFAIAFLFDQPARTAAVQFSILGAILAAIIILVFKKLTS